mgnify:CR=1 FL=1
MKLDRKLHTWDVTHEEAIKLQKELAGDIKLEPLDKAVKYVAGGDISFNRKSNTAAAGFVIYDIEKQELVEKAVTSAPLNFPYIPGLLSFREISPLLEAWKKLTTEPDAVMLDGHGVAHPRRFGLATHFGLWVDKPAMGCAKNVLTGEFKEPGNKKGEVAKLLHEDDIIGYVVRTRTNVNPVFVSAGHKINHRKAVDVALRSSTRYKIPEPTRQAHLLVNEYRKSQEFFNHN